MHHAARPARGWQRLSLNSLSFFDERESKNSGIKPSPRRLLQKCSMLSLRRDDILRAIVLKIVITCM
jgi:hypothetical protein